MTTDREKLIEEAAKAMWERAGEEGAEMGHRLYAEPMHVIEARNPYRTREEQGS